MSDTIEAWVFPCDKWTHIVHLEDREDGIFVTCPGPRMIVVQSEMRVSNVDWPYKHFPIGFTLVEVTDDEGD